MTVEGLRDEDEGSELVLAIETKRILIKLGALGKEFVVRMIKVVWGYLEMVMSLGVSCVMRMRIESVIVIGKVLLIMRRNSKREKLKS